MKYDDLCEATLTVLRDHIDTILNQENVNPLHMYHLFNLLWNVIGAC